MSNIHGGGALSCVVVGLLAIGRLPAFGQATLRFLCDLQEYRDARRAHRSKKQS
jgi:hypothetical protein